MPMLQVPFTDDQLARYRAAYKRVYALERDPTDEELAARLLREAAALTYQAEISMTTPPEVQGWKFS